ncbi:DNA polymerase III subunit beta [Streptomyces xanthochromogenes]|uniref:DNA polymerase III subunit beta n=1 Tax=Streptomyces xanthochromogenes TaxID=67384 RepID=UPI00167AA78A|nr:DNA polymerase III subunit beta [Streptomyces xanthochromogenes]GHB55990.1 DNA polymerase III subunit beta [Streptomyces xanthochromogenes]
MKVQVAHRTLAAALTWSAAQLDPKPMIPARAGLLLEADGDTLTVSGVDQRVSTSSRLDAAVIEPGRIVIPGRLAAQVVATYRTDLVDIAVDGQRVTLQADRDKFLLTLLPLADYPAVAQRPEADGTVDAAQFTEAVMQAVVATDTTVEAEPWRGGIQLLAEGDTLTVWATDRYRMGERTIPWQATNPGAQVAALVPARILADAVRGMEASGDLWLNLTGTTAGMGDATRYTTLARIDEQGRKDPHQFIPKAFTTEASVEVAPLVAAVKRACLVASDKKPKVLIGLGTDAISVRALGEDTGAAAMDIVDGQHIDGPPMQVAFQPANLLGGLQAAGTSTVRIGFTSPVKPAMVHAVGDDTDYRYLVMPVRL